MIKNILLTLLFPLVLFAAPTPPQNLQLEALSSHTISLNWEHSLEDNSGFKIYRDGVFIVAVSNPITSFIDTNLQENSTYTYTVKSSDDLQVYEDAEDGDVQGWSVYSGDLERSSISNIFDTQKQSHVISLQGDGVNNGYQIDGSWANTTQTKLSWSLKYNEDFAVFIVVNTDDGIRYMHYTNDTEDRGISKNPYVHHALGRDVANGTWQTFSRDLQADLKEYEPNNNITSVNSFLIRGSGLIDDIMIADNYTLDTLNYSDFGAQKIIPTPVEKGNLFAHPEGSGNLCSEDAPCDIVTAFSQLEAGKVLFLRGGTYNLMQTLIVSNKHGTELAPIIIESYPSEKAVLTGNETLETVIANREDMVRDAIYLVGSSYISIRNIEIKEMGAKGVYILQSSYCMVEGCEIHDNFLTGVHIYCGYDYLVGEDYIPYTKGYNTIQNNIIYNNSDAGIFALHETINGNFSYEDGDNADGISISSGLFNNVLHNTLYANADDGIDTWRSNDSYVAFNISYDNGRGDGGNGNGIKLGGNVMENPPHGLRATAKYNITYNNKRTGMHWNYGADTVMMYNSSYNNSTYGFETARDTIVSHNIALSNTIPTDIQANHISNSWQEASTLEVLSTDSNSADFLKPLAGSVFENIGAYAHHDDTNMKIFIIGDSTVYNPDPNEKGWGSALGDYLNNPSNVFNQAQSGASSKSYQRVIDNSNDWVDTKNLIEQSDISKGAYLLIQFGHNDIDEDEVHHTEPGEGESYYTYLKSYVDEARAMGVTPVLVTPVSRLYRYDNSHGTYPDTMRILATNENVLMLDLQQKSRNIFITDYESHDAVFEAFGYDDRTHFTPAGASIVASWVKELACDLNDTQLCTQFR